MDNLRLVLLLLGLVLLGGIYLWGRHRRSRKDEWELPPDADLSGERVEPEQHKPEDDWDIVPLHTARRAPLGDRDLDQMRGFGAQNEPLGDDIPTLTDVVSKGTVKPQLPELVVVLSLLGEQQHPISGPQLMEAVRQAQMNYGAQRIFHRMADGQPLFSMANILEPGYFNLDTIENFTTPGVVLFMRLPGTTDGVAAVQEMVDTARLMAIRLRARLCDERRQPVSEQSIARLLDKARPYRATPPQE